MLFGWYTKEQKVYFGLGRGTWKLAMEEHIGIVESSTMLGRQNIRPARVLNEQNPLFLFFCCYGAMTLSNCFLLTRGVMVGAAAVIRMMG